MWLNHAASENMYVQPLVDEERLCHGSTCMALLNLTLTCNVIMCTVSLNYKIGFGTKQFQTIKSYQMYLII